MPEGMITQLFGVVITYVWVIATLLFIEKNYRTGEKESDQDTREVLTGGVVFTLFVMGMIGVNAIKSVFNITFDFLNITLTKQILWGMVAVSLTTWILLKNGVIKNILDKVVLIIGLAILLLP